MPASVVYAADGASPSGARDYVCLYQARDYVCLYQARDYVCLYQARDYVCLYQARDYVCLYQARDYVCLYQAVPEVIAPYFYARRLPESHELYTYIPTTPSLRRTYQPELENSPQRDELICSSLIENLPEFRFLSDATGVQPSPYKKYGLPMDIVDLSTVQDPKKLIDFLQMKVQSEAADSSE
ncbi:uncharacterized protein LOC121871309 [Homarus americanus]|uniref:uncharacterized protein LOC121871309 n=1 Tax=Homarus americanus TaxID=6706 RepID=UPI001C45C936|nr:uncharacterized protein LOC121871309 [Homarus americanus]